MNGLSILFAVVVILSLALICGVIILTLIGSAQLVVAPPWVRRRSKLPPLAHHHH